MTVRMISGLLVSLAIGTTVLTAGCEKTGPAERAGKQFDRTIDDLKNAANHATE